MIDATNVERAARRGWVRLAEKHGVPATAIVLHLPLEVLVARAARHRASGVGEEQHAELARSLPGLSAEGFDRVVVLRTAAEVDAVSIAREPDTAAAP